MVKEPDSAEVNAILRRDGKPKLVKGADCPECHKTTLVESTDEEGHPTGKIVCPNAIQH